MPPRDEPRSERLHQHYDPWIDIEVRYPEWRIEVVGCEHGVEFYWDAKLVLINTDLFIEYPEYATAYVAVCLDDHQGAKEERWTPEQEDHASAEALSRLERAGSR